MAAVHDLGFELGLEGLDLAEDGKAARRGAHLALKLVEDLMQPLSGGPEGRVVLSNAGIHVHGHSIACWTSSSSLMITNASDGHHKKCHELRDFLSWIA
jgi:hypothetical protein